jgi:hypothetical protein
MRANWRAHWRNSLRSSDLCATTLNDYVGRIGSSSGPMTAASLGHAHLRAIRQASDKDRYVDFDACAAVAAAFCCETAMLDMTFWHTPTLLQVRDRGRFAFHIATFLILILPIVVSSKTVGPPPLMRNVFSFLLSLFSADSNSHVISDRPDDGGILD